MLLTYQHNQKTGCRLQNFFLAIIRSQRGSRIIIIDEIFATAFSTFAGPINSQKKQTSFRSINRQFEDANNSDTRGYMIAALNALTLDDRDFRSKTGR